MDMLLRLGGLPNASMFRGKWISLVLDVSTKGRVLNQSTTLSPNLITNIKKILEQEENAVHKCYMSSFMSNVVCVVNEFLTMDWKWKSSEPPVHVYFQNIQEYKYKDYLEKICNDFLYPLYTIILSEITSCMTKKARKVVSEVGDQFFRKKGAFIRIYTLNKVPCLLPQFVSD